MNVNLTQQPISDTINTFVSGSYTGTTEYSLDPNWTPVLFGFESEALNSEATAYCVLAVNTDVASFFAPVAVNAGDTVTILGYTFTASDFPVANEFYTCSDVVTDPYRGLCVRSLADAINANVNLNYRYVATVVPLAGVDTFVELRARASGSALTLDSSNVSLTNPNGLFNVVAGGDANRGQQLQGYDYAVWCELWVHNTPVEIGTSNPGVASLVASFSQSYKAGNRFVFDVSEYLQSLTGVDFPTQFANTAYAVYEPGYIASYYLTYGERFSGGYDPYTELPVTTPQRIPFSRKHLVGQTATRWTAPGAYQLAANDPNNLRLWHSIGQSLPADPQVNRYQTVRLANRLPANKLRRRLSNNVYYPEFVYFFVVLDEQYKTRATGCRLNTTYTFVDGTQSAAYEQFETTIDKGGLYWFDAGLTALDLSGVEATYGKRALYFEQFVELKRDGANWAQHTDTQTYDVDLNYEPDRYAKFWWLNADGVYDSFEFDSAQRLTVKQRSVSYERTLSDEPGYNRDRAQSSIYKQDTSVVYEARSGWVDRDHFDYLQGLVRSTRVLTNTTYLDKYVLLGLGIDLEREVAVAIVVTDFRYERNAEDTLYDLVVTFEVSVRENTTVS